MNQSLISGTEIATSGVPPAARANTPSTDGRLCRTALQPHPRISPPRPPHSAVPPIEGAPAPTSAPQGAGPDGYIHAGRWPGGPWCLDPGPAPMSNQLIIAGPATRHLVKAVCGLGMAGSRPVLAREVYSCWRVEGRGCNGGGGGLGARGWAGGAGDTVQ